MARARSGRSARAAECAARAAAPWGWRWPRQRACSCVPPARSARQETVHQDLRVQRQNLLIGVMGLAREGVAPGEEDESGALGVDVTQRALPHDGAEDLLLVLEVAVERPRGDARVAGDLRDAGAPVAEGGEALLGGGQDAGPGGGVVRLGRALHEVNF